MDDKREVKEARVPVQKALEYRVKNLRSNIVEIVTSFGEVRIAPFETVTISRAIAESAHTTDLVDRNVLTLTIS